MIYNNKTRYRFKREHNCFFVVRHVGRSTAQHARHYTSRHVTTRTCRACRVVSWLDVTQQVEFGYILSREHKAAGTNHRSLKRVNNRFATGQSAVSMFWNETNETALVPLFCKDNVKTGMAPTWSPWISNATKHELLSTYFRQLPNLNSSLPWQRGSVSENFRIGLWTKSAIEHHAVCGKHVFLKLSQCNASFLVEWFLTLSLYSYY